MRDAAKPMTLLLPSRSRPAGIILILTGLVSGYLYYFGGKPSFFQIPVFAVMTSYAETRYFVIAQTNLLDEAAAILILMGLIFTGFSKEKNEDEQVARVRMKALLWAVYATTFFWAVLFMVIFGWPVVVASSIVFLFFLLIYNLTFRIMLARSRRSEKTHENNLSTP